MQISGPAYSLEIVAQLRGARVRVAGFERTEFLRIAEVLSGFDVILAESGVEQCTRDHCDVALVNVAGGGGRIPFLPETSFALPLLLTGSPNDLVGGVVALPPATVDFLTTPWTPPELVARVFRLVLASPRGWSRRNGCERPGIVMADDDAAVTDLLKVTLGVYVECRIVRNGPAALQAVREFLPNALILDVNMPLLNGFEVLRTIRADPGLKRLPVIMLTSSDRMGDVQRGQALGADDYVVKPFGINDFLQRLRRTVNLNPGLSGSGAAT